MGWSYRLIKPVARCPYSERRALNTEDTEDTEIRKGKSRTTARLRWRWDLLRRGGRCGGRGRLPRVRGGTGCVRGRGRSRLPVRGDTSPRALSPGGAWLRPG